MYTVVTVHVHTLYYYQRVQVKSASGVPAECLQFNWHCFVDSLLNLHTVVYLS